METPNGASDAKAQAQDKAQQAKDQAQEKVGQAAEQAKGQAQQAAGQAKGQLRTQVDQRSTQAGQQVQSQASDLRQVAQSLREQDKEGPAKVADRVAERAERAGGYLADSDADRILGDVEDLARKNPLAVVAGGLALGFAASRLLKASSVQRSSQSSTSSSPTLSKSSSGTTGTPQTSVPIHGGAPTAPAYDPTVPPVGVPVTGEGVIAGEPTDTPPVRVPSTSQLP